MYTYLGKTTAINCNWGKTTTRRKKLVLVKGFRVGETLGMEAKKAVSAGVMSVDGKTSVFEELKQFNRDFTVS